MSSGVLTALFAMVSMFSETPIVTLLSKIGFLLWWQIVWSVSGATTGSANGQKS